MAEAPLALDPSQLSGKVVVVTGASRGLGAGMAARFASFGMRLGLCARSTPEAPAGAAAVVGAVDVADATAVDDFADQVEAELGPIDIWINNAGVLDPMGPLRDLDPAAIGRALLVNVGGVANGTATFVRHVRAREGAAHRRPLLVNVSSGAARSIYEGWSVYGACKAAVDHVTEIVAAEEPGIVCHALAPGVVDTDMQALIRTHDEATFPAIERFRDLHRTGAWNSPAWVADHALALSTGAWAPDDIVVRVPNEPR